MTADQAKRLWAVVVETRPPPQMALAYDTGERAIALDTFDHLFTSDAWEPRGLHYIEYLTEERAQTLLPMFHRAFNHAGFDADLARDRINSNLDDYQKIASQDSFEEFDLRSQVYDLAFEMACAHSTRMLVAGSEDALAPMDEAQSHSYTLSVTYAFLRIMRPLWQDCKTQWRCVGVAHYRAVHGRLPESLSDTSLEDFTDPLTDKQPLIYQPAPGGAGFTIYSIGTDREDDGGIDDPGTGDLVIRVGE